MPFTIKFKKILHATIFNVNQNATIPEADRSFELMNIVRDAEAVSPILFKIPQQDTAIK